MNDKLKLTSGRLLERIMLRILGQVSIYGTKTIIDRCTSIAPISGGITKQIGIRRNIPDIDSWCYFSPWYRFHRDSLDEELRNFITSHKQLGDAITACKAGIRYALFSLCPVEQDEENNFACLLSRETLQALSDLGVGLEITPASIMPDTPYWTSHD